MMSLVIRTKLNDFISGIQILWNTYTLKILPERGVFEQLVELFDN